MTVLSQDIQKFIDANHELYSDINLSINSKITKLEINFGKSYVQKEARLVAERIKSNFSTFCLSNNMRMFQYKKDHEYSLCYQIMFKIKAEYLAE